MSKEFTEWLKSYMADHNVNVGMLDMSKIAFTAGRALGRREAAKVARLFDTDYDLIGREVKEVGETAQQIAEAIETIPEEVGEAE